jgi:hypothetical protein
MVSHIAFVVEAKGGLSANNQTNKQVTPILPTSLVVSVYSGDILARPFTGTERQNVGG